MQKNNSLWFAIFAIFLLLSSNMVYGDVSVADTELGEDIKQECSVVGPNNPKESIVLSALTLCLPGIIEKTYEWRQIKCKEAICMYDKTIAGIDPLACTQTAEYEECKYVVSEVMAVPFLNVFDQVKEKIAEMIRNPKGYAYAVGMKLIRKHAATCYKIPVKGCAPWNNLWMIPLGANDIVSAKQTFENIKNRKVNLASSADNQCDRLDEIEEELMNLNKFFVEGGELINIDDDEE